ncbi:hypothetical protein GCM10010207_34810 [Streptomyces atratus]|nr:hypothetical protein GCM10010207_34810 [Streptomyces atratus]
MTFVKSAAPEAAPPNAEAAGRSMSCPGCAGAPTGRIVMLGPLRERSIPQSAGSRRPGPVGDPRLAAAWARSPFRSGAPRARVPFRRRLW